ncbi:MAG TPA: TetR/AcrR family transcriptional regulator [Candidatus Angelobacter sp.]|nr:TetR/AcrR family transcriptional regulator [Candidatus Angelobacter sp.]
MPKIAKERTEENQRRIESAALELFTRQGFHGTNSREIAEKVGVSSGAIYTYFPSKEAIFATLAQRYRLRIEEWLAQTVTSLDDPLCKASLKKFASAIQSKMGDDPEYLLMLLSDVIEFRNQHFLETFHDVPQQLRGIVAQALSRVKKQQGWCGEDPAFVLASVYLYFFTYALLELHMQGENHLGLSHEQAMESFINLLARGMWRSPSYVLSPNRQRKSRDYLARLRAMHKDVRDRVSYIRFLSGRLWSSPPDMPPNDSETRGGRQTPPMLFFPEIPRERIDESQLRIEQAALELFTKQGFHGTNIRDIAEKAGVSLGAIYAYYPSKEMIFEGLVRIYRHCMRKFLERVFRALEEPFSPAGLRMFAEAIRSTVYNDSEYWLLMYIDVIEFKNHHFSNLFHNVPEQFRRLLGPIVDRVKKQPGWCGQDPALVMAMVYFYLVTYFVIEKLMHGNQHLGVSDEEAMDRFITILSTGLWQGPSRETPKKSRSRAK